MPVDADFVRRYASGPSKTTVDAAISVHTNIRTLLGDTDYATLLQGSYKNDTALADMNDVDILVVNRRTVSAEFSRLPVSHRVSWSEVFAEIERTLQANPRYAGKWMREDKCIRVNTGVRVDVVPAVRVGEATEDPVAIYSFQGAREKLNWPRGHYDGGALKSGRTNGDFKQLVRLFKRFVKSWFPRTKIAPSYYIECVLHHCPDSDFTGDIAVDFERIATRLIGTDYARTKLPRIAGQGDLFTPDEWPAANFARFQAQLMASLVPIRAARATLDTGAARRAWVAAFNGYTA